MSIGRAPSWQARINHAQTLAALTHPDTGDQPTEKRCSHGHIAGKCPECEREADKRYALKVAAIVDRILGNIRAQPHAERRAERVEILTARVARGIPEPALRPRRAPSMPAGADAAVQMELG